MKLMMKRLALVLLAAALLAACAPGQPTPDLNELANQIATSVAGTVAAMETATAAAVTGTPSPTPSVTLTPTSFLPTSTPFVITPPTSSGGGGGGGGGGGSSQYSCAIVSEKPYDGAPFKPGDDFDKEWVIKNTGSVTWEVGWDFEYIQGTIMSPTTYFPIQQSVAKGETITIRIEVVAPDVAPKDSPETFVMRFSLNNGSHFCTPYVAIIVYAAGDPNAPWH